MKPRENKPGTGRSFEEWVITAGLYLIEALAVVLVLSVYRLEGKASLSAFLVSLPGIVSLLMALVIGTLGVLMVRLCRLASREGSRRWILAIAMNVVAVITVLLVSELGLRILAVPNHLGENLGGKLLYPKQWERFRETYSALTQKTETQPTFEVFDETLGFTVGPNRRSENRLYFSSVEGLRSARVGESFQRRAATCRIALVGNSYTFGEIVRYEDTWAYLIQQRLGSRCQVLNFGVGGYGVDQMYLRYLKDVRAWHPDLVILAFINHDVTRTMTIYSFLTFPGGMPFAKPRFVLRNGELQVINRPLPSLPQMLATTSIRDLPFIEYDVSYRETEWDRPNWRFFNHSYLFRLLVSLYPLIEPERPQITDSESAGINRKIFEAFREAVIKDGGVPVIVYLPTEKEVPVPWWDPIALKILREAGIPHHDLRRCVENAHVSELFNPREIGGHYSPLGNQVVNNCLFQEVPALRERQPARGRSAQSQ